MRSWRPTYRRHEPRKRGEAVDDRDFPAWLALFAPECAYGLHAMENIREGLRHVLQRTALREVGEDRWEVRSNVIASYTATSGEAGILVSGHCEDLVVLDGEVALFEKRVEVLDNTPPRYLVHPV